jgi:diguanylate cyclase (GGDEF)-like protein
MGLRMIVSLSNAITATVALAREVCHAMGLDEHTAQEVELTALLHDVGKVAIPPQILDKPGELSDEERAVMQTHAVAGQRMLDQAGEAMRPVARAVRASHERWDGNGYPDGLAGDAIPFPARVVACCDALHAMTSERPYRPTMTLEQALAELRSNSGTQFDPHVVEVVARLAISNPPRSGGSGKVEVARPDAHAEQIAAVAQATRELARAHDGEEVRQAICHAALQVSGAAAAVLIEPVGEGWLAETARGGDLSSPSPVIPNRQGLEHPRFMPDTRAGRDDAAELGRAVGGASAHLEPILRDGILRAVIAVSWREPLQRLPAPVAAMIGLLAAEAGVALDRAELLARLEQAARTDELTGAVKRAAWEEQLVLELARAEREGRPLCVVMLDIDHFKNFNDREGHLAGDEVLKECARAWNAELRLTDQLGRYGGDEFMALLPGCTLDDGHLLVERLSAATAVAGQTCSAGIAEWDGEESWRALLRRADDALLAAKQRGRNQIALAA